MQSLNLLFHPEDDPTDIVRISDGVTTSTANGVTQIRLLLEEPGLGIGHEYIIEAAYPFFMKACGLQLEV